MPLYTISTKQPLELGLREQAAQAIVEIHCALTGAPRNFVHVMFANQIPLAKQTAVHLLATVRKGRTQALNKKLKQQLGEALETILTVPLAQQDIKILEIPASWVMEGGEILPEPGEEATSKWSAQVIAG